MTQPSQAKLTLVMHALSLYISLTNPQAMMGWLIESLVKLVSFPGRICKDHKATRPSFFIK